MQEKVNLDEKLSLFTEYWASHTGRRILGAAYWAPRSIAQFNGHDVMVVKVKGEFVWHHHEDTDDLFLVLRGILDIEMPDKTVTLGPGELFVVPKGLKHRPIARDEVHLLLIEPAGTPNTGDPATAAPRREA